ncbi:MAG TPA: hypothetical protein VM221_06805 [Armatimonadota bacterium]|nr:hypothetical protein [Armatimonadota bacterium]
MVRRLTVLAIAAAALALAPRAYAIEAQLGGIRLDQPAMDLLDEPLYGPPDFFGPAGAVVTYGLTAPTRLAAVGAPAGVGFAPLAPARGFVPSRGGGRGSEVEEAAPAPLPAASSFAPPAAIPTVPVVVEDDSTATYWLYNMPGPVQVVVGLNAAGRVKTITVSGSWYRGARTEQGIGLGDQYIAVLEKYGFPDSTQGAGGNLVLRYANAGLTLTLTSLRVTTIALAKGTAAAAARPAAGPAAGVAPTYGGGRGGGGGRGSE